MNNNVKASSPINEQIIDIKDTIANQAILISELEKSLGIIFDKLEPILSRDVFKIEEATTTLRDSPANVELKAYNNLATLGVILSKINSDINDNDENIGKIILKMQDIINNIQL